MMGLNVIHYRRGFDSPNMPAEWIRALWVFCQVRRSVLLPSAVVVHRHPLFCPWRAHGVLMVRTPRILDLKLIAIGVHAVSLWCLWQSY
jgi:hypothetical protein